MEAIYRPLRSPWWIRANGLEVMALSTCWPVALGRGQRLDAAKSGPSQRSA